MKKKKYYKISIEGNSISEVRIFKNEDEAWEVYYEIIDGTEYKDCYVSLSINKYKKDVFSVEEEILEDNFALTTSEIC